MLEREQELDSLTAAVAEVKGGDGRLIVLEEPSGIGKTELLRAAAVAARDAGMSVLIARGGEFEQEYPFGIVRQLLESRLARAEGGDREKLLAGAAGLAASVLEPGESAPGPPMRDPSFQALHGLHWLVSNLVADEGRSPCPANQRRARGRRARGGADRGPAGHGGRAVLRAPGGAGAFTPCREQKFPHPSPDA